MSKIKNKIHYRANNKWTTLYAYNNNLRLNAQQQIDLEKLSNWFISLSNVFNELKFQNFEQPQG